MFFLSCHCVTSLMSSTSFALPVTCCDFCQGPPLRLPMPLSKSERKRSESMEAQMDGHGAMVAMVAMG